MITFKVENMTCGHCASTIARALKNLDRDARVVTDVRKKIVQIQPGDSDAQELSEAIKEVGYSPVLVIEVPIAGAGSDASNHEPPLTLIQNPTKELS